MSVELSITLLNAVIIAIAYVWVYPTLAGKDINKVAIFDCVTSGIALLIVANKYWESGIELNFLLFELNWFWFTLLNYSVIEVLVAIWYFRASLTKEQ